MQTSNYALAERLESVYRSMSLSPSGNGGNVSLLNEMEMSDSEKSLNASRRPFSQIDEDEDHVECDNPDIHINNEPMSEVSIKNLVNVKWKKLRKWDLLELTKTFFMVPRELHKLLVELCIP